MTYPATRELAKRIAAVLPPDVGDAARAGARNAVLDTLGVILAGRDDDCTRLAHRLAVSEDGAPVARLIGTTGRTSASWAAFVNGTAGHALDYDDVDFVMLGHPSVTLVPALIALAEERGIGGARVLEAYTVGFELLHVLGRAVNPRHYRRGFHATATLGSVGVAGACAYLLGLDEAQTRNALSLGASGSAGLVSNFGTMTKPFHAGQSARAGLVAAKLAEDGFTAAEDTLETGSTPRHGATSPLPAGVHRAGRAQAHVRVAGLPGRDYRHGRHLSRAYGGRGRRIGRYADDAAPTTWTTGDAKRKYVLIPDSAHGTNPASAAMAGFEVVTLPSDANGDTDLDALRGTVNDELAGLMITLPSTLGLFDAHILEVCRIVSEAGGIVYGDGANLNALLAASSWATWGSTSFTPTCTRPSHSRTAAAAPAPARSSPAPSCCPTCPRPQWSAS